jgi:hypothetical protein
MTKRESLYNSHQWYTLGKDLLDNSSGLAYKKLGMETFKLLYSLEAILPEGALSKVFRDEFILKDEYES